MKKRVLVIAVGLMLICTACSSKSTIREEEISLPDIPNAESTETSIEESRESDVDSKSKGKGEAAPLSIDETVLTDQEGIKVTALRYDTDVKLSKDQDAPQEGMLLEVENNSDTGIQFNLEHAFINGAQDIADSYASVSLTAVGPGKKSRVYLILDREGIQDVGLGKIGQLDLEFTVYDSDFNTTRLTANPIKTSEFTEESAPFESFGKKLYEDDIVAINALYWEKDDESGGYSFYVYVKNISSEFFSLRSQYVDINGYSISTYDRCDLEAGRDAIMEIALWGENLEMNGITTFSEVSFTFELKDSNYSTINDLCDLKLEL